jgi:hypothetical protein
MEGAIEKDAPQNKEQLEAIIKLEKLILEVNLEDEEMPEYSFNKALLLLNDINGKGLTSYEKQLLRKLIDNSI